MVESKDISIVVPVKNEAGNIDALINEIEIALKNFNYEIISFENKRVNIIYISTFL